MTWKYLLIGLLIGIMMGAIAMRLGNKKLRNQRNLKYALEKSKADLLDYHEELANHFAHSAELLEKIKQDYQKMYQHMAKSSSDLLPNLPQEKNPFKSYSFNKLQTDNNDYLSIDIPPDYPKNSDSSLLRDKVTTR